MKYNILFLLILIFSISPTIFADEDMHQDYLQISESFFPETKNWQAVEQINLLGKMSKDIRQQLLNTSKQLSCVNTYSVFKGEYLQYFRTIDLNLDGFQDVIYSGPAVCQEGNMTIIWLGSTNGFVLPAISWPLLTIKVLPGKKPLASSVEVGCCGSIIDEYFLGESLVNLRMDGYVSTKEDTVRPKNLLTVQTSFICKKELVLRNSPVVSDEYVDWLSGIQDHAVFGNVLSKSLSGATGRVAAETEDAKGKKWAYVILDNESHVFRYHNPFSVDAGWTEKDILTIKKP